MGVMRRISESPYDDTGCIISHIEALSVLKGAKSNV